MFVTKTKNIYLLDNKNLKQYANTGEINYNNLLLRSGTSKVYTFRFANSYSSTRDFGLLIFEEVIISDDAKEEKTKLSIQL